MQQKHLDLFKVIELRKRRKTVHSEKKVTLPIRPNIYEEYKAVKLFPGQSQRRIPHYSTRQRDLSTSSTNKIEIKTDKWEEMIRSYISAKSRFERRGQQAAGNVTFHKLDKVNKHRYQILVQKEISPLKHSRRKDSDISIQKSSNNHPLKKYLRIKTQRYESPIDKDGMKLTKLIQSERTEQCSARQNNNKDPEAKLDFTAAYFKRKVIRQSLLLKRKAKPSENVTLIQSCIINARK